MNERVQESRAEAYSHWIDGQAQDSADGRRLDVLCPSDGLIFATIPGGASRMSTEPSGAPSALLRMAIGVGSLRRRGARS